MANPASSKDQMPRKLLGWTLTLAYMALIFRLSHKPAIEIPPLFPHQDKVFHFCEYFGLGFLLPLAIPGGATRRRFLLAFFLAAAYGISDEIHQSFVPGRDASVWDWLADAAGAWTGAWFFLRGEASIRRLLATSGFSQRAEK